MDLLVPDVTKQRKIKLLIKTSVKVRHLHSSLLTIANIKTKTVLNSDVHLKVICNSRSKYVYVKFVYTNQPTQCSRVLLEKLRVTQLVKKFPAFNGTRRSITMFITACHWSLP